MACGVRVRGDIEVCALNALAQRREDGGVGEEEPRELLVPDGFPKDGAMVEGDRLLHVPRDQVE